MFESKEALEELFPIGYVYKEEIVKQRFYCADEVILDKIRDYHGANNVEQVSPHHAVATHIVPRTVDGYLYDGDYWYPVTHTGYDWAILTREELEA